MTELLRAESLSCFNGVLSNKNPQQAEPKVSYGCQELLFRGSWDRNP